MADSAISGLSAASAVVSADSFIIDDGTATSKKATSAQIRDFVLAKDANGSPLVSYILRQASSYTLTSQTASQKLFNATTNGRVTLPTGIYRFDMLVSLSAMSATSGNARIDILGAGTATVSQWLWHSVGVDGATATAGTQTGSTAVTSSSPASIMTGGTGTGLQARLTGTFNVTGAGTLIPSISLVTAAAAVVAAGSYIEIRRLGDTGDVAVGPWD